MQHDDHDCTQELRITGLERDVDTLNDKVWRGNGKPSLTEQMAVLRHTVNELSWLVATTCAAVIAQVIVTIFKGHGG